MYRILWAFLVRGSGERDTGEHNTHGRDANFIAISVSQSWVLLACRIGVALVLQNKVSPASHASSRVAEIQNIVCVRRFIRAEVAIGTNWEAGKMMGAYEKDGDDLQKEKHTDFSNLEIYFISSEALKEKL